MLDVVLIRTRGRGTANGSSSSAMAFMATVREASAKNTSHGYESIPSPLPAFSSRRSFSSIFELSRVPSADVNHSTKLAVVWPNCGPTTGPSASSISLESSEARGPWNLFEMAGRRTVRKVWDRSIVGEGRHQSVLSVDAKDRYLGISDWPNRSFHQRK